VDTTPQPILSVDPERRGVSRRTIIDEAKAKVRTIDLADLLCGPGQMRQVGERWVAKCPLPGHDERTPSFTVYAAKNSWFCFGACLKGGDVVDLAAAAWGYGRGEMAMAAADLLREFGHEIPPRPAGWYRKNARQAPVRDAIERVRIEYLRRRLFRWIFAPMIQRIEDEDERAQEAERVWEDTEKLAWLVYHRRKEGATL
jgi:DNA primase